MSAVVGSSEKVTSRGAPEDPVSRLFRWADVRLSYQVPIKLPKAVLHDTGPLAELLQGQSIPGMDEEAVKAYLESVQLTRGMRLGFTPSITWFQLDGVTDRILYDRDGQRVLPHELIMMAAGGTAVQITIGHLKPDEEFYDQGAWRKDEVVVASVGGEFGLSTGSEEELWPAIGRVAQAAYNVLPRDPAIPMPRTELLPSWR